MTRRSRAFGLPGFGSSSEQKWKFVGLGSGRRVYRPSRKHKKPQSHELFHSQKAPDQREVRNPTVSYKTSPGQQRLPSYAVRLRDNQAGRGYLEVLGQSCHSGLGLTSAPRSASATAQCSTEEQTPASAIPLYSAQACPETCIAFGIRCSTHGPHPHRDNTSTASGFAQEKAYQ